MRVIVCGGRDFCDRQWLFEALDRVHERNPITLLRQGGQMKRHPDDAHLPPQKQRRIGADWLALCWAKARMVNHDTVNADWKRFGAAAGPIRNGMMIRDNDIDRVIEFPGGDGTADMVEKARQAGIKISTMVAPLDRAEIKVGARPEPTVAQRGRAIELATPEPHIPTRLPPDTGQMSLI